jgi:hypothetical protein
LINAKAPESALRSKQNGSFAETELASLAPDEAEFVPFAVSPAPQKSNE